MNPLYSIERAHFIQLTVFNFSQPYFIYIKYKRSVPSRKNTTDKDSD